MGTIGDSKYELMLRWEIHILFILVMIIANLLPDYSKRPWSKSTRKEILSCNQYLVKYSSIFFVVCSKNGLHVQ